MALSLPAFGSSASPLSISALYEPLYRARIHAGGLSRNECAHVAWVKRFAQYIFNVRHAHGLKLFYKPCFLFRAQQRGSIEALERGNVLDCIECGSCAYICPAGLELVQSFRTAKKIIREFEPDVVIGTGGYVCYPVLKAAAQLGIPAIVHESNAVPGLTTKMLAGAVDRILVGFEESKQHYSEQDKVVVTGTPVRGAFTACSKAEAKRQLGLDPEKPLVVSVWGSLGASYMNEVMTAFITRAAVTGAPFSLIHSAGRNGYEKMHTALLEKCPADLAAHGMDVRPYIYDMPLVMDAADLVLCRAGASTLAELTCIGKPAVLIPSPNVTNNHQERNARVLERAGGAKVLLEGSFTADDLYNLVSDLLADPAQLAQMADNMRATGVSDAAERIADLVLELADRHTK